MKATFLEADGSGLLAEVDLGVYSIPALLRVAYRFTDRCYVHLQHKNEHVVEVRFRSKKDGAALAAIAGEFCNELLDQSLREIVASESAPVRNLIIAHALSRTPFVEPELEGTDPPATSQNPVSRND
ncbi:MAG: hypothetical protein QOK24_2723 [Verrucomicrobiota bacterium]